MMEGVAVHPLKHIVVPKGDIYHALKSTDEGYAGFGEAYFSQIEQGAAKGWKRHNRMTLNLVVPVGAVKLLSAAYCSSRTMDGLLWRGGGHIHADGYHT